MISLIAALTINRVIGIQNVIPWKLPADLVWFKRNTMNKPIIMGRITFESIGRVLPGRINIVVSHHKNKSYSDSSSVIWVNSLDEAVKVAGKSKEIMVIGGGLIYKQMLVYAHRLYLTHVAIEVKGNIKFPHYKLNEWKTIFRQSYNANVQNPYDYCFEILKRNNF
ncbi:type 3 dihydrofolate reductase [Pantoea sp. Aalb]|uniref:type 3 dihydrofolate reductase n=1 Tax=Pantoea sp. Aalb TaxID=2576762 RepID=UPI0013223BBB|nr:type 3 dihydrofolate reductase [Pantoea sp. Aalb]MXP67166.1 type 3 dihydrofolate reductase [Pantoea sp. Aalb]